MDTPLFIIIAAAVVIGIGVSYFFSKKAIIKRKLKKANSKSLANFKSGDTAKIVGTVEIIGDPLIAPLSGRECSYYYVHVEEKVKSGKSSHWKTRIEEEVPGKFLIKEGEKYALINDSNIKSYIVQDRNYSSGFLDDAEEHLERYLNSKGYESEGFLGMNRTLRYKEGVLEEGEQIAVFGTGNWKDAATFKLPEEYGKVLEVTSTTGEAIYLSDDPDTTKKKIVKNRYSRRNDNFEKRYKR